MYSNIILDQKLYLQESTKKYTLPLQFSKSNLDCYPFATLLKSLKSCIHFSQHPENLPENGTNLHELELELEHN